MKLHLQQILRTSLGNSITAVPCSVDLEQLLEFNNLQEIELDLHELLAKCHEVAVIWCVEDVQSVRPDLNDAQAWEVLQACHRVHDCEIGFNWLLIETVAEDFYPAPSGLDSVSQEE